ncbi:hypothetical protein HBI53_019230 [Parastagonospora nodorum]|nr:hypothetical protein HBI53_019230 [Parastagonospora nodorum]
MSSLLEPEAGIFYALCWIVVILRFSSRRLHLGSWKRLQLDDFLILVAMATDTVLIAMMHIVVQTNSNLVPSDMDVNKFSDQEINDRIHGSKIVLVVEQMQILTIWIIKACLLIMYRRMTLVLPQRRIVIGTSIYVAIGFVVMEVLYFAVWCRPFSQYWQVRPRPSPQCNAATNHLITNAVFNISSDLIILSIPIPLLFRIRLPKKNKAVLVGVFMIGSFSIIAAVLNKFYSFKNPFGTEWTVWYLRESYTAILCANLPLIYPLIQRVFKLRNWSSENYTGAEYRLDSAPERAARFSHPAWNRPRPKPAYRSFRGMVSRRESEDISAQDTYDTRADGSQFITSAIDMDDMRSPTTVGPDTPTTWGRPESREKGPGPYHPV